MKTYKKYLETAPATIQSIIKKYGMPRIERTELTEDYMDYLIKQSKINKKRWNDRV